MLTVLITVPPSRIVVSSIMERQRIRDDRAVTNECSRDSLERKHINMFRIYLSMTYLAQYLTCFTIDIIPFNKPSTNLAAGIIDGTTTYDRGAHTTLSAVLGVL